jgi:N-acetylmuramoyl-L-alanine amidase
MRSKVFLTAGHRGSGTGAVGIIDEGQETIRLRNLIGEILRNRDVEVYTDRDDDNLSVVVENVNVACGVDDICIDIHFNAFNTQAQGSEIFIPHNFTDVEKDLAQDLLTAITNTLKTKSRGVKKENSGQHKRLAMLSDIDCHSIVVEICFCDNTEDALKYQSKFNDLAYAMANVILEYV